MLIISCLLLYWPALGGGSLLDDPENLNGIDQVQDLDAALVFLAAGHGTPLGRPIALASFFLNHHAWPTAPDKLLWVNLCIHLLNGVLVFYLLYLIGGHRWSRRQSAGWIALLATAFWLCSPLLASSSLMIIQRMTTLSATFLIVGLIVFVKGRLLVQDKPRAAAIVMTLGVCGGMLLSVLTKENGVLLPLFALTIDRFLMRRASLQEARWLQWWRMLLLGLPLALLAGYVLVTWPNIMDSYRYRQFDLAERLLTESRILWTYLVQLFVPRASDLGPFHDDVVISASLFTPQSTFFAVSGWLLVFALLVRFGRRFPLPAFAMSWFLGGHLLESTVFSLELYFEHRNYVPSIGPYFAASALLVNAPPYIRRLTVPTACLFLAIQSFVLYQVTSTWGVPYVAANVWHQGHPTSTRAAQYLSQQHLALGEHAEAFRVIDDAWQVNPMRTDLALQSLQVRCPVIAAEEFDRRYERVLPTLQTGIMAFAAVDAVRKMVNMYLNEECRDRPTTSQLWEIIAALTNHPGFQGARSAMFQLHHQSARLHLHNDDLRAAVSELEQAFGRKRDLQTALVTAGVLASAGDIDAALRKLDSFLLAAPRNPVLRRHWETMIQRQKRQIREAARQHAGNAGPEQGYGDHRDLGTKSAEPAPTMPSTTSNGPHSIAPPT